jgi:hypothetical protein
MLTIKEWMELVDHRITEGGEYGWRCFGTDAYSLSSWNGDQDGWSFNIVFDTKTQAVYQVEVCDYKRERAYRMINPDFQQAYDDEAATHGAMSKQAWDDVDYIDLEIDEDFVAKAMWIKTDQDYDTRVDVPLNLPDDVLFELMKRAHEQDITLNKMVEEILWVAIHAEEDREVLDSQYPDGDGYWRDDADWDEIAEDHGEDDGDEMESDLQDLRPAAKMKAKKKKKK